jgi:hypothetical protein
VEATLNLSVGGQEEKCQSNREAAKSLLQGEEGADLRAVHSNKSLSALIKSSSDKIQAEGPRVLYHVRTHDAHTARSLPSYLDTTYLLHSSTYPSNASYLHICLLLIAYSGGASG